MIYTDPTIDLVKKNIVWRDICGNWIPCALCIKIFYFNMYLFTLISFHTSLEDKMS